MLRLEIKTIQELINDMEHDLKDPYYLIEPEPVIGSYIKRLKDIVEDLSTKSKLY